MTKKLAYRLALLLLFMGNAYNAMAADWSDTYIGYGYSPFRKYPGTVFDVTPSGENFSAKNVPVSNISFTHVSGYQYGTNFFEINRLITHGKNNPEHGNYGQQGSREVFGVYRHILSLSAVSGKKLGEGFIRDYGINAGFNFGSNNDAINAAPFELLLGPSVSFDVPGFWNIGFYGYKEYNNNRFNTPAKQVFKLTWSIGSAWNIDIGSGKFRGFLNIVGPKGYDTAHVGTKMETLLETYYLFDISKLLTAKKDVFYAGVGLQYWNHKFGTFDRAPSATRNPFIVSKITRTPILRVEAHF